MQYPSEWLYKYQISLFLDRATRLYSEMHNEYTRNILRPACKVAAQQGE